MMALRNVLGKKDHDLLQRVPAIEEKVREMLPKHALSSLCFAVHGITHCDAVVDNLNMLLPREVKENLNPFEIFALLSAAYLHDIGMVYPKSFDENLGTILKEHNERSAEYVLEHWQELGFREDAEAKVVAELCRSDSRRVDIRTTIDKLTVGEYPVRISFLASLLRLADACDMDFRRAPLKLCEMLPLRTRATTYWMKHQFVTGIKFDSESNEIIVEATVPLTDSQIYEAIIKKLTVEYIQNELDSTKDILTKNAIPYERVRLQVKRVSSAEILPEVELQEVMRFLSNPISTTSRVLEDLKNQSISIKVSDILGVSPCFSQGGSIRLTLPSKMVKKYNIRKAEYEKITFVFLETGKGVLLLPLDTFVNPSNILAALR